MPRIPSHQITVIVGLEFEKCFPFIQFNGGIVLCYNKRRVKTFQNKSINTRKEKETRMGLGRLMVTLKSKIRSLKIIMKKPDYDKVEKSESMRMEIRSKKARKLIEETLKVADSPKSKAFAF
ncbi:hypothetical protein VNO78_33673 [Psophocarpus tetragonolobus]|uniref:Uncharacterized protein n=1 Tax=Psophocarpus tetragonolobus TaxID=3891 RepID=A0AAN9NYJ2_PSOTE